MKKILLADDHQIVLDGLHSIIDKIEGYQVVALAANGSEAVKKAAMLDLDIIILDLDMPGMDGIKATQKIRETNEDVKIIILSMHNEKSLTKKAIDSGANGYILKSADVVEFEHALNTVQKGKNYYSADVTNSLLNSDSDQTHSKYMLTESVSLQLARLSKREMEVLRLIVKGMGNKEVGEKLFISHRTVDSHRTNLMKKLEVHNLASLVKVALQAGIL
jgi:two-component system response regulator NreC